MAVTHTHTAYGDSNVFNLGSTSPLTAVDVLVKNTSTSTRMEVVIPKYQITAVVEGVFSYQQPITDGTSASGLAYKMYIYSQEGVLQSVETWANGSNVSDYTEAYRLSELAEEDVFIGSATYAKRDHVQGLGGNDRFIGNGDVSSGDLFFGGSGIDTSVYRGKLSEYTITKVSDIPNSHWEIANAPNVSGLRVTDKNASRDGIDSLNEVERLQFSDVGLAFDSAKGENAGQAYRLYKAAFDRTPDTVGLGYWINSFDGGSNVTQVAASFIASPEFSAMYGANSSNDTFVTLLYQHVLHRMPDAAGLAYWNGELQSGHMTRAAVLASFSESPENVSQVAAIIGQGFQYQPWGS